MSLMDQAKAQAAPAAGGAKFKRPDIGSFVPTELKDAVDRIAAAGLRLMTSPQMREEVLAAVQSPDAIPKKLAENVTGLMLTMDQQAQGGIPAPAIFPAALELMCDAADALVAAGQNVTQEDWNAGAQMLFVMLGQKMGASDEELMQGAAQAVPREGGAEPVDGAVPDGMPPPPGPDDQGEAIEQEEMP